MFTFVFNEVSTTSVLSVTAWSLTLFDIRHRWFDALNGLAIPGYVGLT